VEQPTTSVEIGAEGKIPQNLRDRVLRENDSSIFGSFIIIQNIKRNEITNNYVYSNFQYS